MFHSGILHKTTPATQQRVAKPCFHKVQDNSVAALCQTLSQLTASGGATGWILVLAPTYQISKQMLEQCGVNTQRVLLINQKQIHHYDNLMRDALTCSTCEAVLSFLPEQAAALADYAYLANKYQTTLINHSRTETHAQPTDIAAVGYPAAVHRRAFPVQHGTVNQQQ